MKLLLVLSLCTLSQTLFAPTGHIYGTRPGEDGPPYYHFLPGQIYQLPPTPQKPVEAPAIIGYELRARVATRAIDPKFQDPYRIIEGKTYDLTPLFVWLSNGLHSRPSKTLQDWEYIEGEVLQVTDAGLLVKRMPYGQTIFIRNDPKASWLVDGRSIATVARWAGRHQYITVMGAASTVAAFDYGKPLTGQDLAGFRKAAAERAAAEDLEHKRLEEQKQAALQEARDLENFERLKKLEAQSAKIVEFQKARAKLDSLSTNAEASK